MKWNLRLVAAKRDIWKASEVQQILSIHGLEISSRKMSGLWSGNPVSLKLDDLDVICVALNCQIGDLLTPEPEKVLHLRQEEQTERASIRTGAPTATAVSKHWDGWLPPPE
ncbi:helix-turn-helix domain-containing protein [Streptomyces sp. NPDC059008]|uniref:helix-turn-helix domain-containing protein n=1 Tax=Streptomyces sp. NPDC059008 TaxID=3346693 RepID=UPI003682CCEC